MISILSRAGVALVLLCGVLGCGADSKPAGEVSGKVTYQGDPVGSGTVNFLSTTGAAAMARISTDGSYTLDSELEAGEYKVYLLAPVPEPVAPGTRPPKLGKFTVPKKYLDPTSSDLTVIVKEGPNEIPIEMK